MIPFFVGMVSCLGVFFRSRYNLGLEILALRQQLGVLSGEVRIAYRSVDSSPSQQRENALAQ